LEKKHHYFSIKKTSQKNYIHHIRKTSIYFPFLLEKKAKILRERVTQCTLCFRKKDFSFPSMFPTIFIDSTQKLKKQILKCEKRSFCLSSCGNFSYFYFYTLPFLPSKIQNKICPSPLPLCVQNLK